MKKPKVVKPIYFKPRTILAGLIYEGLSAEKKDLADKVLQLLLEYEPIDEREKK